MVKRKLFVMVSTTGVGPWKLKYQPVSSVGPVADHWLNRVFFVMVFNIDLWSDRGN